MLDFQQAKIGSLIKIRFFNTKGAVCLFAHAENPMNALAEPLYTNGGGASLQLDSLRETLDFSNIFPIYNSRIEQLRMQN